MKKIHYQIFCNQIMIMKKIHYQMFCNQIMIMEALTHMLNKNGDNGVAYKNLKLSTKASYDMLYEALNENKEKSEKD